MTYAFAFPCYIFLRGNFHLFPSLNIDFFLILSYSPAFRFYLVDLILSRNKESFSCVDLGWGQHRLEMGGRGDTPFSGGAAVLLWVSGYICTKCNLYINVSLYYVQAVVFIHKLLPNLPNSTSLTVFPKL